MVEFKCLTLFKIFHTFYIFYIITYLSPNFEVEGEWIGVAIRITEKAKNESRKKLKHIGKCYIFKVASKYFATTDYTGDKKFTHYRIF